MTYVALCGHHGAGKSHFATTLSQLSGWPIQNKQQALRSLYQAGWCKNHPDQDWRGWNAEVFHPAMCSRTVDKLIELAQTSDICILDAIHNPLEWHAIKRHLPKSVLVGVFSPEDLRRKRRDETEEKSSRRVLHWHEEHGCLLSLVDWGISGILPENVLLSTTQQLISYVETSL